MVLRITDSKEDFGIATYKIPLDAFGRKEYHPLLAAKIWDKVYIDLNDNTPRGYIKQLVRRTQVIPVFDDNNVTPRVMSLLCEVCPDDTSRIRVAFMNGPEQMNKLVAELKERWI